MFETLSVFILFFIIWFGLKMFRGCFSCSDIVESWNYDICNGKEPFYVIIVASSDYEKELIKEIKCLRTKNRFTFIIVNDAEVRSEYTRRAIDLARSMLMNNKKERYHPILAFKTSVEYQEYFSKFFGDVCILEDFSSDQVLVYRCPGT